MCAINPRHELHLTISVYTSIDLSTEEFIKLVLDKALEVEMKLNEDMRLRWHVHEIAP